LDDEVLEKIDKIGCADILVGIPSFRNADTIAHVVEMAARGMVEYFPDLKPVLVNSDGGSEDCTCEAVENAPVPPQVEKVITPYRGLPGKGSAFHAIFEIAVLLKARVCIVVDSDLRSITPEWIKLLGEPVWRDSYGFVAPYYIRHKYDGTITNSLAYPLNQVLYGRRIRQPIGGDFGLSGALALTYSNMDVWKTDIAKFGIDIWMTTTALAEGFRVCQAAMGVKIHNMKDPGSDLGSMFTQVASTIFMLMREYEVKWMAVEGSVPTRVFGELQKVEPVPIEINLENLIDHFTVGWKEYRHIWKEVMEPTNFREVATAVKSAETLRFTFPNQLWARIVFDFAVAYNFSETFTPQQIVEALVPLYCARTADFTIETRSMSTYEAEQVVLQGADEFELLKPYLVDRWRRAKACRLMAAGEPGRPHAR
jgi:glycosyltransferase involved in cell wall biosynthesis